MGRWMAPRSVTPSSCRALRDRYSDRRWDHRQGEHYAGAPTCCEPALYAVLLHIQQRMRGKTTSASHNRDAILPFQTIGCTACALGAISAVSLLWLQELTTAWKQRWTDCSVAADAAAVVADSADEKGTDSRRESCNLQLVTGARAAGALDALPVAPPALEQVARTAGTSASLQSCTPVSDLLRSHGSSCIDPLAASTQSPPASQRRCTASQSAVPQPRRPSAVPRPRRPCR